MSCSKCKKKEMMDLAERESLKMEKWTIFTFIVIITAAIYGVYSLIVNLL